MQIERGRRNGSHLLSEGLEDGWGFQGREANGRFASAAASDEASSPSPSPPRLSAGSGSIEHRVSKMDTLAGIAIKYGVEIADIKRVNGLVTDQHMFAHKKLQIPLPGRHPPSPGLANDLSGDGQQSSPRRHHNEVLASFQSLTLKTQQQKVSPAMSILQGYYGLTPPRNGSDTEGTEMRVYKNGKTINLDHTPLPSASFIPETSPSHYQNTRSSINGFFQVSGILAENPVFAEDDDSSETDRSNNENSVRRRQKIDVDLCCRTPELLLKEENGVFSGRSGKGLIPRPKFGSRTDLDTARPNINMNGDSFMGNGFSSVRKSSSASNLQESDNPSIWPRNKWTLKTESITKPLFDGLPKPMTLRKNKAALD